MKGSVNARVRGCAVGTVPWRDPRRAVADYFVFPSERPDTFSICAEPLALAGSSASTVIEVWALGAGGALSSNAPPKMTYAALTTNSSMRILGPAHPFVV